MNVIVFSKDRACQLDLLLRSFPVGMRPVVQADFSGVNYAKGYVRLIQEHRDLDIVFEDGFKDTLLNIIDPDDPLIMFLTDDDVFLRPFELYWVEEYMTTQRNVLCLSLRLKPGLKYCYTLNREMREPEGIRDGMWEWKGADADYGYPMSLDGHIFRTKQIMPKLWALDYNNPNTLEGQLAKFPINLPHMACFPWSIIMNNPLNRVQNVWNNRCGNISAEWLNEQYLSGKKISLNPFINFANNACHQEIPITLE